MLTFLKYLSLAAALFAASAVAYDLYVVFTTDMPGGVTTLLLILAAANTFAGYWNFSNFRRFQTQAEKA